jgi:hypothetical protein
LGFIARKVDFWLIVWCFYELFAFQETISDKNYSAYSCQCKGVSVNKLGTAADYGMKEWRCMGHYDWIDHFEGLVY